MNKDMKFFKYFTYSEIKDICNKLDNKNCYFRHPQSDFISILGQETVNKLVEMGSLKDSSHITYPGTNINLDGDYNEPCYEYGKWFKKLYNFITVPFCTWLRIYVLHLYWFRCKWQSFRIWCGHHYDWQDYMYTDTYCF